MAETSKRRRVGPLPWQIKLRLARMDREWDVLEAKQRAITAQLAAQQAAHSAAMAANAADLIPRALP